MNKPANLFVCQQKRHLDRHRHVEIHVLILKIKERKRMMVVTIHPLLIQYCQCNTFQIMFSSFHCHHFYLFIIIPGGRKMLAFTFLQTTDTLNDVVYKNQKLFKVELKSKNIC